MADINLHAKCDEVMDGLLKVINHLFVVATDSLIMSTATQLGSRAIQVTKTSRNKKYQEPVR